MTMTESKPSDRGNPVMRSMEIEENGVGDLIARGVRPRTVECVYFGRLT